jgi:hypothetical protein
MSAAAASGGANGQQPPPVIELLLAEARKLKEKDADGLRDFLASIPARTPGRRPAIA